MIKKYKEVRFQNCPWYIRLWRYRHYLTIPFWTIRTWLGSGEPLSFDICWVISKGMAQHRMKWYYTMDEVRDRVDRKIREKSTADICDACGYEFDIYDSLHITFEPDFIKLCELCVEKN